MPSSFKNELHPGSVQRARTRRRYHRHVSEIYVNLFHFINTPYCYVGASVGIGYMAAEGLVKGGAKGLAVS